MHRRHVLLAIPTAAVFARGRPAAATPAPAAFRIGYQKNGILAVARQRGLIEKRLAAQAIPVQWAEFTYGPPLLEALNAGAIDFGTTGDVPPVFAQVASAELLYVAAAPSDGDSSAILVPADSPIRTLGDLKGKRIGFAKGSSAHHFTVRALDKAGLAYGDITSVYLPPADAAAAFAQGSIDAWTIWDPFYAIAQLRQHARVLVPGHEIIAANSFYLANRSFTAAHGTIVGEVLDELAKAGAWGEGHRDQLAADLAAITGVDLEATKIAVQRAGYKVVPMNASLVAQQQALADRFLALNLIPSSIKVEDAVWQWTPQG